MKVNKTRIGILAGLLVVSAAIFAPLYAVFASNTPIRSVSFKSSTANYDNGDAGAWKIDEEAYWTKKGYANVKLTVNAIPARSSKHYDMVLLVDEGGFKGGEKINEGKSDLVDFAHLVLSDGQSRVAVVGFSLDGQVLSDFTDNESTVTSAINSLSAGSFSNFYKGFKTVNTLLDNYTAAEGRELVIVLATDGYPDVDYPQERAEYRLLKDKFAGSKVYGIQYRGGNVSPMLDDVTDVAVSCKNYTDFEEALVTTTGAGNKFEHLIISDYIDNEYFELTGEVKRDFGAYQLGTAEDGTPMVIWDVSGGSLKYSGASEKSLTFGVKLKDQYLDDNEDVFPINKELTSASRIIDNQTAIVDSITSGSTPKLKLKYWVNYVANTPSGCDLVGSLPQSREEIVYDQVKIADDVLTCGDQGLGNSDE